MTAQCKADQSEALVQVQNKHLASMQVAVECYKNFCTGIHLGQNNKNIVNLKRHYSLLKMKFNSQAGTLCKGLSSWKRTFRVGISCTVPNGSALGSCFASYHFDFVLFCNGLWAICLERMAKNCIAGVWSLDCKPLSSFLGTVGSRAFKLVLDCDVCCSTLCVQSLVPCGKEW